MNLWTNVNFKVISVMAPIRGARRADTAIRLKIVRHVYGWNRIDKEAMRQNIKRWSSDAEVRPLLGIPYGALRAVATTSVQRAHDLVDNDKSKCKKSRTKREAPVHKCEFQGYF